ncbi:hypothetical protein EHP00_1692 [Ecytonucleospora hepatopenaei]|uniref:Uncharacterized protein n=1 Tax=Ecytonucleospora hepatopenaei TaxID=646526 RepID=A0A1W0E494_9MICR|nr:hypothetical protein EHP00_1692 [Ecytonucleospora hepatopenaei]
MFSKLEIFIKEIKAIKSGFSFKKCYRCFSSTRFESKTSYLVICTNKLCKLKQSVFLKKAL